MTFFACSKDNTLSIQKTGSPCECLQELPVSVLICLGFTLQILPAQQLACHLHPEFPAACPLSHIPWSQRLFSPAPKTVRHASILSIQKTGSPCDVLQELPVFVSICLHFTLRILPARQSACPLHPEFPAACPWWLGCSDFFACSKDNTLSIRKTDNSCEFLQELPVSVLICLGFTLQILPAQQLACPLHLKFPAACPLSHIPWSQRLFSPAPKTARRTWFVPECLP